jgi:hypothetical protein
MSGGPPTALRLAPCKLLGLGFALRAGRDEPPLPVVPAQPRRMDAFVAALPQLQLQADAGQRRAASPGAPSSCGGVHEL